MWHACGDMITHWLEQAGRHPLLTPAEELHLGGLVRQWLDWQPSPDDAPAAVQRRGRRAKDRMVAANLRLVAHVTRKARHGLGVPVSDADLPDLFQAGAMGLIRGIEKFDPTRGYKVSTYAYWWIRQGVSRWADSQGRTIRVPTTHAGAAAKAHRVASHLAAQLGRTPTRSELAAELGVGLDELDHLLLITAGCHSLDSPLPGVTSDDASPMIAMLAAPEHLPDPRQDQLLGWIEQLDERSQRLIRGRYGIGEPEASVTDLARREGLTIHRLRGLLRIAEFRLRKLRDGQAPPEDPWPTGDAVGQAHQLELPESPAQPLGPVPGATDGQT